MDMNKTIKYDRKTPQSQTTNKPMTPIKREIEH